jgi:hypothetical protein
MAFAEMVPTTKWRKAGQNADTSKVDALLEQRNHGTKNAADGRAIGHVSKEDALLGLKTMTQLWGQA